MRLKSRSVVLKKAAPCRLCGRSCQEGFLLKGPSKGFVCGSCHESFYAPLIEENRFRLRDLATREVWSPLIVRDGETAMAYLKAEQLREASVGIWWAGWILLVVLIVLTQPSVADVFEIPGRIISALGRLGGPLARLSVPGSQIALLPGRLMAALQQMIENIADLIAMFR